MNIEVNFLSVFLAAIGSMIVGFLWYSPLLFAKPWMKEMGLTMEKIKASQKEMGKLYALSFVVALISAFVLSHVMFFSQNYYHRDYLHTGLDTAFFMWLGFIMPVQLTDQIFGSKKWRLFAINTGYQLIALIVMAVILASI